MSARDQYLTQLRSDYIGADKQTKTRLLNEAEKRTKLARKYLIAKLRHRTRHRGRANRNVGVPPMARRSKQRSHSCGRSLTTRAGSGLPRFCAWKETGFARWEKTPRFRRSRGQTEEGLAQDGGSSITRRAAASAVKSIPESRRASVVVPADPGEGSKRMGSRANRQLAGGFRVALWAVERGPFRRHFVGRRYC